MIVIDIFFALFWLGSAIAVWSGAEMPVFTMGCGLLIASLYNVETAFRRWDRLY